MIWKAWEVPASAAVMAVTSWSCMVIVGLKNKEGFWVWNEMMSESLAENCFLDYSRHLYTNIFVECPLLRLWMEVVSDVIPCPKSLSEFSRQEGGIKTMSWPCLVHRAFQCDSRFFLRYGDFGSSHGQEEYLQTSLPAHGQVLGSPACPSRDSLLSSK